MNELADIRHKLSDMLDEFSRRAESAERENRDLKRLLRRVIGLAGKDELTPGDEEQLRQARKYVGEDESWYRGLSDYPAAPRSPEAGRAP